MYLKKIQNKIYDLFAGTSIIAVVSFGFFFSILSFYLGFNEEEGVLNSIGRTFTSLICFFCILVAIRTKLYQLYLTKNAVFLLLLYVYYAGIIYNDLYLVYDSDVVFLDADRNAIMQRIIRLVFIPMLSLIVFRRESLDLVLCAKIIFFILFWSLLASLTILQLNLGDAVEERVGVSGELNSLNMGYWAATEFLLALFLLTKSNKAYKIFYLFLGLPLSLYVIMISGSRGPLLYTVIIALYYLYLSDGSIINKKILKFSIVIFVLILIFDYSFILEIIKGFNPVFVERIEKAINEGDSSGRDGIYMTAIDQFLKKPFFGDYFVLTSGGFKGSYPHNILIEALMAFGLVGAIPLFVLMGKTFYRVHSILKINNDNAWIALFFLISFFKGLSTWNLYGNALLWVSMFIILTYDIKELKND